MSLIFKKSTAQPNFEVGAAIIGTAQVGQSLECTYTVTKARAANVRVEWWRHVNAGADGTKFADGATCVLSGNEFQHAIRAIVYASNPAGTVQSVSAFTAEVTVAAPPDPPTFDVLPSISGDLETGGVLTVAYTLSGETSVSRQWYRYTSLAGTGQLALEGQSGLTYTVTEAEVGLYVGCVVTATNSQGDTIERAIVGPITQAAGVAPTIVTGASVTLDDGAAGYYDGEYLICDAEVTGHTSTPTFAWYKCDNADGTGTPTLLTGAGIAAIQPLPYSEPNAYRGAIFLDESLALGSGGKYVYCVMSATNSQGTTTSTSAAVGPIGTIQGTPISQATVGDGSAPYEITSTGTYYLTEDLTFDGSGIIINAPSVRLNLNGHTLTFDDATPIPLLNGSFEDGDANGATNWNFDNAGGSGAVGDPLLAYVRTVNAAENQTAAQFAYNNQLAHDGNRSLWLVGSTVTGTSDPVVTASVTGTASTDLITATGNPFTDGDVVFFTSRSGGTGLINQWPLYVKDVSGDTFKLYRKMADSSAVNFTTDITSGTLRKSYERYVESAAFECPADTWLCVGFHVRLSNPSDGARPHVFVRVMDGTTEVAEAVVTNFASTTSGPQQLYGTDAWLWNPNNMAGYLEVAWKTPAGSPKNYTLRVGACSISAAISSAWFDDFRVTRVRPVGVTSPTSTSDQALFYDGKTSSGTSIACRNGQASIPIRWHQSRAPGPDTKTSTDAFVGPMWVCNGSVIQGQGASNVAAGLTTGPYKYHRLTVSVNGVVTSCIRGVGSTATTYGTMSDATCSTTNVVSGHRELWYGSLLFRTTGTLSRVKILNSPASGVFANPGTLTMTGCEVRNRSRVTNAFGVMCYTNTSTIDLYMDNCTVDNTGEYWGRGVGVNRGTYAELYNNYFATSPAPWNRETSSNPFYQTGNWGPGDYALQIEGGRGAIVVGNELVGIADGPVLNLRQRAIAIKIKDISKTQQVEIYNNVVRAYAGDGCVADCISISNSLVAQAFQCYDNQYITNSNWCEVSKQAKVPSLVGGTLTYSDAVGSAISRRPLVVSWMDTPTPPRWDLVFRDVAADAAAAAILAGTLPFSDAAGSTFATGQYRISWTATFSTGASGDVVTVKDKDGLWCVLGDEFEAGIYGAGSPYEGKIGAVGTGFSNGDAVVVRIVGGTNNLSNGVIYYVRDVDGDIFNLATTAGGSAITIGTSLTGFVGRAAITTNQSGVASGFLPSQTTFPTSIVDWNAAGTFATGYTPHKNGVAGTAFTITEAKTVSL